MTVSFLYKSLPLAAFLSRRSLSAPGIMTRTCGIIVNSNCTVSSDSETCSISCINDRLVVCHSVPYFRIFCLSDRSLVVILGDSNSTSALAWTAPHRSVSDDRFVSLLTENCKKSMQPRQARGSSFREKAIIIILCDQ